MSASDIPETFASPNAMARALASYIACPREIRRRVMENFFSAPSIEIIAEMRRRYLAPSPFSEPAKPHDGYYPSDASAELAKTNALFLLRLDQERTLSLAMRDYRKRVPALVE